MKLSILIVNYNTEGFIVQLLQDLTQQSFPKTDFEILIVNNVQNKILDNLILEENLNQILKIKIIPSETNIGFGRAMNLAANFASGEHLMITNPDLRILQPYFLLELVTTATQYIEYGIISTQIVSDKAGYKTEYFHYEFNENLGYDNQVCWISGALLLLQSSVFKKLSGFDPDFFMYCEDEDLSYRIKQLDLPLIILSHLQVYHYGGASEPNHNYDFYYRWYRSRLLFSHKHFSQEKFNNLLIKQLNQSKRKISKFKLFKFFYRTSYTGKVTKWQVLHDIIEKIQKEGTDWLYFRPS